MPECSSPLSQYGYHSSKETVLVNSQPGETYTVPGANGSIEFRYAIQTLAEKCFYCGELYNHRKTQVSGQPVD